jgi:hypothetical protein
VLAAALLFGVPAARAPQEQRDRAGLRSVRPRYLVLGLLNVVMLLHNTILQLALPLYVLTRTDVPASVVPLMFVLNTVLVVLLQRRLSRRAATLAGAANAERTAGYLLAGTCVCLAAVGVLPPVAGLAVLGLGVVLLTVGESLQIAGSWELSHAHAPAADRGAHLVVFSMSVGVQNSVGPAVATLLTVWGALTWFPLAAAFVLAGTATRRLGRAPWHRVGAGEHPTAAISREALG